MPGPRPSRRSSTRRSCRRATTPSRRSEWVLRWRSRSRRLEQTATGTDSSGDRVVAPPAVWSPPRPRFAPPVDFAHLDTYEVRVFEDLGGAELRAAIELVSPANKDRDGSRRTFAAKCAGYLQHGINVVIVDVVTARSANLHRELSAVLEIKGLPAAWQSTTGLYVVAYRAVTVRKRPRIEISPETLSLGEELPTVPLWLALDTLLVPVDLEASYTATCRSLQIPA